MRRSSLLLSICLVFALAAPVSAAETFRLETVDFSLTVPGLSDEEITVETGTGTVSFYHTASRENGGGLIGTLVTVTPRCAVFSPAYTQPAYRIVAMGTDRAFLWRSPGGGVNCGPETLEDFVRAAEALSVEQLRRYLRPAKPDDLPVLRTERHLAYLTAEDGLVRPDDPLTRGELAEILYALLEADNQRSRYQGPLLRHPGRGPVPGGQLSGQLRHVHRLRRRRLSSGGPGDPGPAGGAAAPLPVRPAGGPLR